MPPSRDATLVNIAHSRKNFHGGARDRVKNLKSEQY
jgi:hypothetical protein